MSKTVFADLWAWTEEDAHNRVDSIVSQEIYFRVEDRLRDIGFECINQAWHHAHLKVRGE